MGKVRDLTEGNVGRQIFSFSIPIMFGALFQQFYNVVDTAIVGKILGVEALAAVGATGSVMFLILGFCNGLGAGFAIPIAQKFGAKDEVGVRRTFANCIWLGIIMSVLLTVVTTLECNNILSIMDTPDNIVGMSYSYLFIIFLGIPVTFFYNMLSGILRALGDSKTPLYFLIFSSLLNIGLDIECIKYLGWGTAGAAIATVAAQLVAGVMCAVYMRSKYPILHMEREDRRFDAEKIKLLLSAGVPMGLQYSITAIGSILLQTAVNGLGSDYVASMTSGGKISMFVICPFDALGTALATFTGQNVGARKLDRVDEGLKQAIIGGTIYSIVSFVFLYIFGDELALIFVDKSQEVIIHNIHVFLICNAASYLFLLGVNTFRFVIQGMGYSVLAVTSGVMEMLARGLMGVFIVPKLGFIFACFASPLAWVFACAFLIPAYLSVRKKMRVKYQII
ncbi:MAG: MATE family efflux transporter [Lachnospiraceae bacterium]|nr:MATE family efflux transporter [Candidatus Colinaster equi]